MMLRETDDAETRAAKLQRIADALIDRVDRLEETRGSAWSMFQAAVALEQEAIARTRDLEKALEVLRHAHERNDEVLERIYIGRRFTNDTERLEKLFEMYTKMTTRPKARA